MNEVFSSDLNDASIRQAVKPKLAEIRKRILLHPLNPQVVENLSTFMSTLNVSLAIRSSGSAEDLASQSFAGQYDTFLYKQTLDEDTESIKACWASMFKDHILDYATKPSFLNAKVGEDITEPDVYQPGSMKPPKMGVLVMKMVEAKTSGVCFSQVRNLRQKRNAYHSLDSRAIGLPLSLELVGLQG